MYITQNLLNFFNQLLEEGYICNIEEADIYGTNTAKISIMKHHQEFTIEIINKSNIESILTIYFATYQSDCLLNDLMKHKSNKKDYPCMPTTSFTKYVEGDFRIVVLGEKDYFNPKTKKKWTQNV